MKSSSSSFEQRPERAVESARGKKRAKNGRRPGMALTGIGVAPSLRCISGL